MTWIVPGEKMPLCPMARTFVHAAGGGPIPDCRGADCPVWRWEKVTVAHPVWAKAVRTLAESRDEKPPYAKAAKEVADNLVAHGLVPVRGFCGLGGQP